MRPFIACKKPIGHNHASPPDSFLNALVDWASAENEIVFTPNKATDIYSYLWKPLGPWTSALHRRAVMCEAMRVIAGDESDWNWREGRDTTAGPQKPEEMEAGAFQVSYDSRRLSDSLSSYLLSVGILDAYEFQQRIKADPSLDMAYTARLLRVSTHWDGPLNRGWVTQQVSRDAVAEFQSFLAVGS